MSHGYFYNVNLITVRFLTLLLCKLVLTSDIWPEEVDMEWICLFITRPQVFNLIQAQELLVASRQMQQVLHKNTLYKMKCYICIFVDAYKAKPFVIIDVQCHMHYIQLQ